MILPQQIQVLDKGFVRLIDFMGGDAAVVRAARVSYGSDSVDEARDRKLIAYMLRHQHGSPFEHTAFTFHVKAPIFVFRQWHRHRAGVSYNEASARYKEMDDEFYIPIKWRGQDGKNRQGSVELNMSDRDQERLSAGLATHGEEAMVYYRALLASGVAREMARMVLPVNLYSEQYFTCNARSLMHFIGLRSEQHAQFEIRQYSHALWRLFALTMPWTAAAFLETLDLARYNGGSEGTPGPNPGDIPHD